MKANSRKLINFSIGIILAAVLLWIFFKNTDWAGVGEAIASVSIPLLLGAYFFQLVGVIAKSWRWKILLSPLKKDIPVHSCFKFFNIGFACTSLLPGRLGEVLRPFLMAREQKIKFTPALATIIVERVVDLLMILVFFSVIFVVPSALGPNPNDPNLDILKTAGLVAMAVAVGAAAFLTLLKVKTQWAINIVRFFTKPLPEKISTGLVNMISSFAEGVGGLKGFKQIGGLVLGTLLGWVTGVVFYWLAFKAFGIEVPFVHCFFLQAVTAMGVVIPTPAGSGGFHAGVILVAATLWGLPETIIQAYAILTHLIIFGSLTLFGIFYLIIGNMSLFDIASDAEQMNKTKKAEVE